MLSLLLLLSLLSLAVNSWELKKTTVSGITAVAEESQWFAPSTAPIAPLSGNQMYTIYSDKTTGQLIVLRLNKSGSVLKRIEINSPGSPLDIIAVDGDNFIFMARGKGNGNEPHHLYLQRRDSEGKLIWNFNIMQNDITKRDLPNPPKNQMAGFEDDFLWQPHNGRLAVGANYVVAIFARHEVTGHTGDTIIGVTANEGKSPKIISKWHISHSLHQQMYFDGTDFIINALGDAYPEAIRFSIASPSQWRVAKESNTLIGPIPGCGCGQSYGRLGSLNVNPNGGFITTYQRRASKSTFTNLSIDVTELGITFWNKNFEVSKTVSLKTITGLSKLINLKSVITKDHKIVIAYTVDMDAKEYGWFDGRGRNFLAPNSQMYVMVLDLDGKIISQPTIQSELLMSGGDDIEVLSDGTPIWVRVSSGAFNLVTFQGDSSSQPPEQQPQKQPDPQPQPQQQPPKQPNSANAYPGNCVVAKNMNSKDSYTKRIDTSNMWHDRCLNEICKGSKYAAVSRGTICYCFDDTAFKNLDKQNVADSICTTKCAKDDSQYCGGNDLGELLFIRPAKLPKVSNAEAGGAVEENAFVNAEEGGTNVESLNVGDPLPSESNGLSGGAIAGIVIGCVVGVALIAALVVVALKPKHDERV